MGDWKNHLLCVNYIELPTYVPNIFCRKNHTNCKAILPKKIDSYIGMIYLGPTTFFLTCSRYLFGRKFAKIWFGLELITCFFGIPYLKHLKEICNVADEIFSTVYKYGSRHGCALYISRCT